MTAIDGFTFVEGEGSEGTKPESLFDDYRNFSSGKVTDLDLQVVSALRAKHPDMIVTTVPGSNCNLLRFAAAGFAFAELDDKSEPVLRWTGFVGPQHRGGSGYLADNTFFARYNYTWNDENFILYTVAVGYGMLQYILKEPRGGESQFSHSSVVNALLATIGAWLIKEEPAIYVFDGYWTRSTKLWEEVKKARWEDVILDPKMKKALAQVANKFFDSKDIYDEYGVPWKRGLIFHGPVGNGKTISLKALMNTLQQRKKPVVTLYVKSAPSSYHIRSVFQMARAMTPCLLVLEDIDTIVTSQTRSYFFNEVDGLENNDGILMIATTNHLDQLDPGLSKRPSRFDRKYLFPMPNKEERSLYAQYWRNKLKNKKSVDFPAKLCDPIAEITDEFSFAYLKEAFMATLLEMARNDGDENGDDSDPEDDDDPLNKYEFWLYFKATVKALRSEMGSGKESPVSVCPSAVVTFPAHEAFMSACQEIVPLLETMRLQQSCAQPCKALSNLTQRLEGAQGSSKDRIQSGSVLDPLHTFAPLASSKRAHLNQNVWEWGL